MFARMVEIISNECHKRNISINKALTDSGAGKNFIDNLKSGKTPGIDKVFYIANYFGISIDYLVGHKTKEQNSALMHLSNKTVSGRIRQLRTASGKSRSEMAEMLCVSYSTLVKWESGHRAPDIDALLKLADIFNVSVDYLAAGVEKLPSNALFTISEDEQTLIDLFRSADKTGQERIIENVELLSQKYAADPSDSLPSGVADATFSISPAGSSSHDTSELFDIYNTLDEDMRKLLLRRARQITDMQKSFSEDFSDRSGDAGIDKNA